MIDGLMQLTDLMPAIGALIPYEYRRIKNTVYDDVISGFISRMRPSPRPKFIQIGGIPGAGKTTFCKSCGWDSGLFISFDAIMESIPQYRQDVYKIGHVKSFNKWEIPARIIGYEVLRLAVEKHADIFLEHSGVNTPHVQLLASLKKNGYETEVYFILCDKKTACQRAFVREKITGRHTPESIIAERASLVQKYLPQYFGIADNLSIYDTSADKYVLVHNYRKGIRIK